MKKQTHDIDDGDDLDDIPDYDQLGPLGLIVEQEAHRILSEAHLAPDPELIAQGWERRFMGDARRVQEAVELYKEMGFEVLTQPVRPAELTDDCDGCRLVVALQFQTIYTRKKQTASSDVKEQS